MTIDMLAVSTHHVSSEAPVSQRFYGNAYIVAISDFNTNSTVGCSRLLGKHAYIQAIPPLYASYSCSRLSETHPVVKFFYLHASHLSRELFPDLAEDGRDKSLAIANATPHHFFKEWSDRRNQVHLFCANQNPH